MTYAESLVAIQKMTVPQVQRAQRRFDLIRAAYKDVHEAWASAIEAELLAIETQMNPGKLAEEA